MAYTVACVQLKSHRNVKQLGTIRTRPIAISRVLRAISDGPKDGWTDRPTDQHHLSANIIKVLAIEVYQLEQNQATRLMTIKHVILD